MNISPGERKTVSARDKSTAEETRSKMGPSRADSSVVVAMGTVSVVWTMREITLNRRLR